MHLLLQHLKYSLIDRVKDERWMLLFEQSLQTTDEQNYTILVLGQHVEKELKKERLKPFNVYVK